MKRFKKIMIKTDWLVFLKRLMMAVAFVIVLSLCVSVRYGIKMSEASHAMVEVINEGRTRNRNQNAYPTGNQIDYDIEARVEGDGFWSRGALAADFDDQIEFRLRIAAEDLKTVSTDLVSVITSSGLIKTAQNEIEPVDEHIIYVPLGVYEFTFKDWITGESVSSLKVMYDGDYVDELDVLHPYNELDVPFLTGMIVLLLVFFGVTIPVAIGLLSHYYPWRAVLKS